MLDTRKQAQLALGQARLRIARPTARLGEMIRFYRHALGFQELAQFQDHDGFDGVMLGHPGAPYHLEFTRETAGQAVAPPHPDALLVFYLPDRGVWLAAVGRLWHYGAAAVPSANPYWDRAGLTFEDPDGNRIVLQNAAWPI